MNAIKPTGEIISTECQYCLECQVFYWDEHRCPPLVDKRNRSRKWRTRKSGTEASEIHMQPENSSNIDVKPIIHHTINTGEKT